MLIIVAIFVAVLGVVFAMQNNVSVIVTFLFWRFDSSLAMVLLLALAIGAFIAALVSTPSTLRRKWTISRQNKRIAELESRVSVVERDAGTTTPNTDPKRIGVETTAGEAKNPPPQ